MLLRYLKQSIWSFVLSCIMSWCLAQMCFLGFYIPIRQQSNLGLLTALVVIVTGILWLASFNKRTTLIGVIGFVAAAVIAFVWLRVSGNMLLAFSDTEDAANPYLYYMICFAVIIGIWLLSSTRRGTFVCLIIGICVAGLIHFLYHNNQTLWLILFLVACMVNLAVKNYQNNTLKFKNQKISFSGTVIVALCCVLLVLVVGCGAFYGIVRPMQPPVRKVKLFERDMSETVVDRAGLATEVKILDPSLVTDDLEENPNEGSDSSHNDQDDPNNPKSGEGSQEDENDDSNTGINKFVQESRENVLNVISYPHLKEKLHLTLLIILILLAAGIVLKVLSHRIWLKLNEKRTKKEQISRIYHLCLRKFRQIKEAKNKEETPYEYAAREEMNLSSFITPHTDFMEVTDIFVRSEYGAESVSEADYGKCIDFYQNLFPLLRRYLGLRWILKFFVL